MRHVQTVLCAVIVVGLFVNGCRRHAVDPSLDVSAAVKVVYPDTKLEDLARELQGTWVIRGEALRSQVWSVNGTSVDVYDLDPGRERRGTLLVKSPCRAEVHYPDTGESSQSFDAAVVAYHDGDLYVASRALGVLRGGSTYVCDGQFVWRLHEGICQFEHGSRFTAGQPLVSIEWTPATCALDAKRKSLTTTSSVGWQTSLSLVHEHGMFVDHSLPPVRAIRVADMKEGRAVLENTSRFTCSK